MAVLEDACANRSDIHHLIVTCNVDGKMFRESAGNPRRLAICLDDAVNDRGLAMTSSFSNMAVFGQCLANAADPHAYESILNRLVQAGRSLLPTAADCAKSLADEQFKKACFVGSGPLREAARECALKLLELTAGKVLTMSESALGLRHGPMAALDEQTLLVAFLSGDERVLRYETDLLEEIGKKQLVATRVVVSPAPSSRLDGEVEHVVSHSRSLTMADDYRPPLDVMFGQLLGLFFSISRGLKPDCPSPSGAISRVVQNVLIHS